VPNQRDAGDKPGIDDAANDDSHAPISNDDALLMAAGGLLRAFGVTDSGVRGAELVDAESAAVVAGFHYARMANLDGESRKPDLAAAISIYSTVLPSRPDLVPAELHQFLRQMMAEDSAGHCGIGAALIDQGMVLTNQFTGL
jgi:hypothetical protein